MESVEPITVPQSHVDFAKAVAELAEQYGMAEFTMEYVPDWLGKGDDWDRSVQGKARILFKAKDGRGRPCRNLSVVFDACITRDIVRTQSSSN